MADEPTLWGPIAAGISTVGAIGGFGYFMDNRLTEEFRSKMRDKLNGLGGENWPTLFLQIFDRLFDTGAKYRPRLWRSALASISVLALLTGSWAILLPNRAEELAAVFITPRAIYLVIMVVVVNVIGDFFSLWESRFVIRLMADAQNVASKSVYLLCDFVATVAIFVIIFSTTWPLSALVAILRGEMVSFEQIIIATVRAASSIFAHGLLVFSPTSAPLSDLIPLMFYTTLFTSVWVWLFMLGGLLSQLFSGLRIMMNVDKYPVGSAMAIGGVFGGLAVTVLGYVRMALIS